MAASDKLWKVHDKQHLFLAVMEHLAGNSHISFEGDFNHIRLSNISGASSEETSSLKRNTLWPKQDFVVVPLEPNMKSDILSAIGGALPRNIIHVQIEKADVLEFGAYDNFSPGSVYFGSGVKPKFLESLVAEGIIELVLDRPDRSPRQ